MDHSAFYDAPSLLLCIALLAALAGAIELGFRAGLRKRAAGTVAGVGTMEAVIFGLFGLLLALTFSTVMSRADARRILVVEEANAIGTAYLRLDLVPEALRAELRAKMRDYVDARVELAAAGTDDARAATAQGRGAALQAEVWQSAADLARQHMDSDAYALLIDALNRMIDMQTSRDAAMRAHVPPPVIAFLALTAVVTAVVAGYALGLAGNRHTVATMCFLVLTVLVAYMILDIDRPRRGLFRTPDGLLIKLQQRLHDAP